MRSMKLAAPVAVAVVVAPLSAQQAVHVFEGVEHWTMNFPVELNLPYQASSGLVANAADAATVAFAEHVQIEETSWVRIYFGEVHLAQGSYVRITSLLDGEVQVLDAGAMEMWGNASAYFNGNNVTVELVAGAGTVGNLLEITQVGVQLQPAIATGAPGGCGICGVDNRLPAGEEWTARLFPAGCTASVYNEQSCMVTAGHCVGGNMVVQFNVPDSNANCSLNNPPVADQFPAQTIGAVNGGPGNDWGVLEAGTNNLGEQPYDRYGVVRPISTTVAPQGAAVQVTGYGVDDQCTRTQTQQDSSGSICSVSATAYTHNVDATFGNSGSALIRNDEIIGINTHCPCCNVATRVDRANFSAAREACPAPPATPLATGVSGAEDGFLLVAPDAYGAWAPPFGGGIGSTGDRFNPEGAFGSQAAAFTSGFFLFNGSQRELLATSGDWQAVFDPDNSLVSEITLTNLTSDTNDDGVDDTAVSAFTVSGGQTALSFGLMQHVENINPLGGPAASVLTQVYTITNNGESPIAFELVRAFDADLTWVPDFSNDSVGTGTNGSGLERYVYQTEVGQEATAITLSSPQGNAYYGGKNGVDPDGPGGSVAYGFGTDVQVWDAFGVPIGWRNNIAGVGDDTDGESGAAPPGSIDPQDGFIGLEIPVDLDSGASTTVTVRFTYGSTTPIVIVNDCPWDCGDNDGEVGIVDFLALLSQWDEVGTSCDFDGVGVGIIDFLKLLAQWGVCP